jgi:hypothetical protein
MAKDDLQPNSFVHIRRSDERTVGYWQQRLEELEARHTRKRRSMDDAIADYKLIAAAMAEAQDMERKRPTGADPQKQFGQQLERARLRAERERLEYHGARIADLERLTADVSRARDQLISEASAVDALQREIGTAAETIRQRLWYAAIERDSAANYVTISESTREQQQRAARELATEERGRHYGRGLL